MSTLYRCEVHVLSCPITDGERLKVLIEEWGLSVEYHHAYEGHVFLGAYDGPAPENSHEDLRELLPPGTRYTTSWLDLENRDWDEVIGPDCPHNFFDEDGDCRSCGDRLDPSVTGLGSSETGSETS